LTLVVLSAALVSGVGMFLVLPWLRRLGVVDVPNSRSSHLEPTPRGGGVAVVVAIVVATGVALGQGLPINGGVLVGTLVFGGLGMADDLWGLDVSARLAAQAIAAAGVAAVLVQTDSAMLLGTSVATAVIGTVWLVGYTNAFNFMDGVNGISSLNAVIAGGWFLYLGVDQSLPAIAVLGAAVAGSALGFLPWNAPRARVFLGDVGSYAWGASIASLALWAWIAHVPILMAAAPTVIYLADTGSTLARRVLGGRSWREAHREHVYQRLADLGLGHLGSAAICAAGSVVMCLWAFTADRAGLGVALLAFGMGLITGSYLALPRLITALDKTPTPIDGLVESGHRGPA
jgi:UDP-GlcNAc:undecaprenyl-phosphate/decaprenyl-phosphate GlcNAc-1-phosphate transferase